MKESLDFAESLATEAVKITTGIRIYPHTGLSAIAPAQGSLKPGEALLLPRFYLAPGLESQVDGVREMVAERTGRHPEWMI